MTNAAKAALLRAANIRTNPTYSEVWSESEARWVPEAPAARIARITATVAAEEFVAEHDVRWLLEIATASLAGKA